MFWKNQDNNWLIGIYKKILEKHILEKPYLIDLIDRLFNPILGKSLSIYFEKKIMTETIKINISKDANNTKAQTSIMQLVFMF